MFVCGFSIVRNGVKYNYPFVEAIKSVLPLVDVFYVNVGKGEDNTLEVLKESIKDPKLKIVETEWDMSMREGGKLLSFETNRIMRYCEGDWGFYIQADEVVHEDDYDIIYEAMKRYLDNPRVEGLSFRYIHFEGTYDYVNPFRYRKQVRIVRLRDDIVSWGDAAGFRKKDGRKLRTKPSGARIFHYGWVRSPEEMLKKQRDFEKLYHDDEFIEKVYRDKKIYTFPNMDICRPFKGTHPAVMHERIKRLNWQVRQPRFRLPLFLNPKTYRILLHKWGILKGDWWRDG